MSLENIPVVQRHEQKDFGFSGMFNYEVVFKFTFNKNLNLHLKTLEVGLYNCRYDTGW
jgi:hypothetical protein